MLVFDNFCRNFNGQVVAFGKHIDEELHSLLLEALRIDGLRDAASKVGLQGPHHLVLGRLWWIGVRGATGCEL